MRVAAELDSKACNLITHPVHICNECVNLCNEVLEDEVEDEPNINGHPLPKPAEIKAQLDEHIV